MDKEQTGASPTGSGSCPTGEAPNGSPSLSDGDPSRMAGEMTVSALEALLPSLMQGEFSSLTIGFNDANAPNYATVERFLTEWTDGDSHSDWVSEEERQKAMATNSWWSAHWYPQTPVGFHCISASTLPALIAGLRKHASTGE